MTQARGYKYGLSAQVLCKKNTPGRLASRCGQAPIAKENTLAPRPAAQEVVVKTMRDGELFQAPASLRAHELRSLPIAGYMSLKGIIDADLPVKQLFPPPAYDPLGDESRRAPRNMASPRDVTPGMGLS